MKRLCIVLIVIASCPFAYGRVTLELDAGILSNKDGAAPVPMNGLLQIISLPAANAGSSSMFSNPTPGSFVDSNRGEVIVANLRMNYLFGPGETNNTFAFDLQTTAGRSPTTNDPLLLRWWPDILTDSSGNPNRSPLAGDVFGQFRSNSGEFNGSTNGITWFVPADGTFNLNFNTTSTDRNNHPDSDGYANFTVVPEPSTYALLGAGVLGFGLLNRRRGQAARG